ncbi:hypothetical protein OG481_09850 [Streptomyces longwoodensis]|uniref:hypothetical protein n=1 Tax=Streptomyces longwoodensis TaxID=68231 RepID=UPI002DDB15FA|nr:hypothetical protein [Streptomyces longwoodensis]WRY88820.1 hypothetical protein OG481_09850 [Streptomyces longwoodensis]
MAQNSWPSPTYNARAVTDLEYEKLSARFSDDGIYGSPSDTAVVAAGVGLSVDVRANVYGSVRGRAWSSGTTAVNLPVASNSSGSTRIDWVVLRLDRSTWNVRAVIRQGTPGAGAPALVQDLSDTGLYEIPLAKVTIANGATVVSVTRAEQYVGTRTRPCTSTTLPPNPLPGEHAYETNTGLLRMWTGSAWVIVYQDTGVLSLTDGFSAWSDAGGNVGRLVNGVVTLRVAKTLTGSRLLVTDGDGSKVAVVPTALRPVTLIHYFSAQFSGGHAARAEVRTDGSVWVRALSEDVPTGNTLLLTMTYVRW